MKLAPSTTARRASFALATFDPFTGIGKPEHLRSACQATGGALHHWRASLRGQACHPDEFSDPLPLRKGMMTEKPHHLSAPEDSDGPLRSFEELGAALGRDCANVTRLEESPVLDTEAAT